MNTQDNKLYYDVNDITEMLDVSTGFAYKLIRSLNKDLAEQGYIVIAGKVPSKYFKEKYYGCDM